MCGERYYRRKDYLKVDEQYQDRQAALSRFIDDRALLAFLLKQERILDQQSELLSATGKKRKGRQFKVATR
jgi:hypothetical protein